MKRDGKHKDFDCVASMRKIRDQISAEIAGMSDDELSRWLQSRQYSDPVVRRLASGAQRPASRNYESPQGT
ncbi:MAG: hypothetical protein OXE58_16285 [Acidobacteria bacterium]|nr:hypothetical protein [Acidobacteriota bacterium]